MSISLNIGKSFIFLFLLKANEANIQEYFLIKIVHQCNKKCNNNNKQRLVTILIKHDILNVKKFKFWKPIFTNNIYICTVILFSW